MSFVCRACGSIYKTAWGLKIHERRHEGLGRYTCCEKQFFCKESMTRHMCSTHGASKQYVCMKCRHQFATQVDLNRHRRREDCEASFTCDICDFSAKEKIDLKAHMDGHSGEKNYRCKECGKFYRHRSSLCKHRTLKHAN